MNLDEIGRFAADLQSIAASGPKPRRSMKRRWRDPSPLPGALCFVRDLPSLTTGRRLPLTERRLIRLATRPAPDA